MPTLELRRSQPLSEPEAAQLPAAVDRVLDDGDLRACVVAPADPGALVALVVHLARAVPDATVTWVDLGPEPTEEAPRVEPPSWPPPEPGPPPPPRAPQCPPPPGQTDGVASTTELARADAEPDSTSTDPWACIEEGAYSRAVGLLDGKALDSDGRAVVRGMLQGTDPARVAAGCRIARATRWRSSISAIRRLLGHADTRVRLAAVEAIGSLAGPGLIPTLMRLQDDPSPAVQRAAAQAIATIEG